MDEIHPVFVACFGHPWTLRVDCTLNLRHSVKAHLQGKELQAAKRQVGGYPKEFRRMAVERWKTCDNIVPLSQWEMTTSEK